jgi:hypothetical protein
MATPIGIKSFTIFLGFVNVLSSLCVLLCFKLFHPSYVSCCLYTSNSFLQVALYVSSFSLFACSFYVFFCLLLFWVLLEEIMKQKYFLPFAMLMLSIVVLLLLLLLYYSYFHHCAIIFVVLLVLLTRCMLLPTCCMLLPTCYYWFQCVVATSIIL